MHIITLIHILILQTTNSKHNVVAHITNTNNINTTHTANKTDKH